MDTSKIKLIKACRCSFVVEIEGEIAFISNQNFYYFVTGQYDDFRIIERKFHTYCGEHSSKWVEIRHNGYWSFGFISKLKFGPDGTVIARFY